LLSPADAELVIDNALLFVELKLILGMDSVPDPDGLIFDKYLLFPSPNVNSLWHQQTM
jgi:hypothetical protein